MVPISHFILFKIRVIGETAEGLLALRFAQKLHSFNIDWGDGRWQSGELDIKSARILSALVDPHGTFQRPFLEVGPGQRGKEGMCSDSLLGDSLDRSPRQQLNTISLQI